MRIRRSAAHVLMHISPCPLCGTVEWQPLDNIHESRSVRTDGVVIAQPLSKFHCAGCGLAIRSTQSEDPAALYGEAYQLYSNRPGAEQFDAARYVAISSALRAAWGNRTAPKRVLEVGCGDGSLLHALKLSWPGSHIVGLEPSGSAVGFARTSHRPVYQGMIGQSLPTAIAGGAYDLIYAVHVIEHTPDPATFLMNSSALLAPGGRLIVTCPDGTVPHAELIHSDHLFSMTPKHLAAFAHRSGQNILLQVDCPAGAQAEYSQLMVCAPSGDNQLRRPPDQPHADALYRDRQAYLRLWKGLEADLLNSVRADQPLYCFGAGGWTGNIAGYCPQLWDRVVACAVDGGSGASVHGKDVLDYRTVAREPRQFIAVVNPASQSRIAARLTGDGHKVIRWPGELSA
jgi:2-polyprenyl-3-methyl-5-hydroxy-6-metoxy-1,4-benzoquinol methylase